MIKITMLTERPIPVHGQIGKVDEVIKVNNEVGHALVKEGDAEYLDPEMMDEMKKKWDERGDSEMGKAETAALKPSKDAMMSTPKAEKPEKKVEKWRTSKKRGRA